MDGSLIRENQRNRVVHKHFLGLRCRPGLMGIELKDWKVDQGQIQNRILQAQFRTRIPHSRTRPRRSTRIRVSFV